MNKKKYEFAYELFVQMQKTPFSKVSISDICDELKCSRQSFYYYFKTLEDCFVYYTKESFKANIKDDYLISDLFNYFDKNEEFFKLCEDDKASKKLFWTVLFNYVKKILDMVFAKNLVEYLTLYSEQKDAVVSFYAIGLIEQVRKYLENNKTPSKDKCIEYCKCIIGSGEDNRAIIRRFNR